MLNYYTVFMHSKIGCSMLYLASVILCLLNIFVINGFANTYYYSNQSDLVGELQYHRIGTKDTWDSVGSYYNVGYDELRHANPGTINLSRNVGRTLIIPSLHVLPAKKYRGGLVVNLAEKRLYYFLDDHTVLTYPVSIGKDGWETPSFFARVNRKKIAPKWYVPDSIQNYYQTTYGKELPTVVEPGPDNPLGNYAIYLTKPRILIHGTNTEQRMGSAVSSGCVRMYNRNIQELFFLVPIGTRVYFIHEDEKLGTDGEHVYLEKHWPYYSQDPNDVYDYLDTMQLKYDDMAIDKDALKNTHRRNRGVPERIGVVEDIPPPMMQSFAFPLDDDDTWLLD